MVPFQFAAKSLLYTAVVVLSTTCGFHGEPPIHHDRMVINTDSLGRVMSRTYDQLVTHFNKRAVVTITQRFDTSGRMVSEYGTDHPYFGKHYLNEFFYDSSMRVVNQFRWPKTDTSSQEYTSPANSFYEQRIFFDTATFTKYIRITRVAANSKNFIGRYYEILLSPINAPLKDRRISSYTFKIPVKDFLFDNKARLVLNERTTTRIKNY